MKLNIYNKYIFITPLIIIFIVTLIYAAPICKLSDSEAIAISENLCAKLKYNNAKNFKVVNTNVVREVMLGIKYKAISAHDGNNQISIFVRCDNSDVVGLYNDNLYSKYIENNTIEVNNKRLLKWVSFISDKDATNTLLSIGKDIGLPEDVELSSVELDKYKGVWTGRWKRILNGIEFDGDYIIISILGASGELYSFTKVITGEPYSTNPEVSRQEAIEIAKNKFIENFTKEEWKNNNDKFEVTSCVLKYIKNKQFINRILLAKDKSQLAWVVTIDAKNIVGKNTIGIINKDTSVIYVDAKNRKVLYSDINIAH